MIFHDTSIDPEKWAAFRVARLKGGHVLVPDAYWIIGYPEGVPKPEDDHGWVYLVKAEDREEAYEMLRELDEA